MGNRETTASDDGEFTKLTDNIDVNKLNLSLNGCGYVGIYHVGVCSCLRKYYPHVLTHKISGGSVGALVAATFMCEVPLSIAVRYVFDVSMKVRSGILGPMSPSLNIMNLLYERMDKMLPSDAHLRCNGRLNVSVTKFDDNTNVLLTEFKSREDLLQALMCSCFIPIYCGYELPKFNGTAYADAALSNNSPRIDEHTVTVAPFSGKSDICPENDGWFIKSLTLNNTSIELTRQNLCMMFRVLFPGTPDMQKEYCQQGYNDALRFLRDKGMIPCPSCVADGPRNDHSKCEPIQESLPKEITKEFDLSIQTCRRDFKYRLMQYKSMKLLYYLNIPSIVTAKVAYTAASMIGSMFSYLKEYVKPNLERLVQAVQRKAGSRMDDAKKYLLQLLKDRLESLDEQMQLMEINDSELQLEDDLRAIEAMLTNDPSGTSTRSGESNLTSSVPVVEIEVERSLASDRITGPSSGQNCTQAELNDLNKTKSDVEIQVPERSRQSSDQFAGGVRPTNSVSCSRNGLNDLNSVEIGFSQRSLSNERAGASGHALHLNIFDSETQVAVTV